MRSRFTVPVRTVLVLAVAASMTTLAVSGPPAPPSFVPNHAFVGGYDTTDDVAAVFEFDAAGAFVRKIAIGDRGTGGEVYGVTFGPDGRLFCGMASRSTVVAVAPDLTQTTILDAADGLGFVVGVEFGPGARLFAASRNGGGTLVEATVGGEVIGSYTAAADQAPSYVTVGSNGHLYLSLYSTDSARNAIVELDAGLREVRMIGEGEYASYPANVVFTPAKGGVAYVADYGSGLVHELDPQTLATTDSFGVDGISDPYGSAIGPDGHLYVASYGSKTVKVLKIDDRSVVRELTHPDLDDAAGIAFAPFRFAVKSSVSRVEGGGAASVLKEKDGVLSYAPGFGRAMLLLSNGAAFVGNGTEVTSGDGSVRFVNAQSAHGGPAKFEAGSLALSAAGALDANGAFAPKSLAGQVQFNAQDIGSFGAFKTKKRVP